MDQTNMYPTPSRGGDRSGRGQSPSPWRGRGGQNWRGRNSSGSSEQLFASPYQDVRSNPYGWSEPRPSFNRGSQQQHQQPNRWQNRRSCGTPQGHSRGSYNKRPFDTRQQGEICWQSTTTETAAVQDENRAGVDAAVRDEDGTKNTYWEDRARRSGPAMSTKPSVCPPLVNWYQICLGRMNTDLSTREPPQVTAKYGAKSSPQYYTEGRVEVDIRAYVIPAMTGNPWKHLEEQWNAEHNSVISTKSATSN